MRAYILDWSGTLTILGERTEANGYLDKNAIKAFLDVLHARGDVTFGYSGMLPDYARDWFTFGNSKEISRHLEYLAHGKCAQEWEWDFIGKAWMPAGRLLDPQDRHLPWREQREWDPSKVTEIVISDDDMWDTSEKQMSMYAERVGTPVRFVHPRDLMAELGRV